MVGSVLPLLLLLLVVSGGLLWLTISAGSLSILYLVARWPAVPQRRAFAISDHKMLLVDGSRCIACRLCVDTCPTDTFALETGGSQLVLTSRVSECVACELCVWICPTAAISLRSGYVVVNRAPAPAQSTVVEWEVPACGHQVPPAGVSMDHLLEGAESACSYCSDAIQARMEALKEG